MSDIRVAIVVAAARNGVIGRSGGLPWRLPSDLKIFKRITMGKPIIMGRKTYQSIGRPLPGRSNIVITRNPDFADDGISVVADLMAALDLGRRTARESGADEICVIGGGEIYAQALPLTDRVYLTRVDMEVDGDTRFPDLPDDVWREIDSAHHDAQDGDMADFEVVVLDRIV